MRVHSFIIESSGASMRVLGSRFVAVVVANGAWLTLSGCEPARLELKSLSDASEPACIHPPSGSDPAEGLVSSAPLCTQDGQIGCITTEDFRAVDMGQFSASEIPQGITIAGVSGSATDSGNIEPVNPWDLRLGVSLGGLDGKLRTDCRNQVNLSSYDIARPRLIDLDHTSNLFVLPSHNFVTGESVRLDYSTTPSGLNFHNTYYVIVIDAETFQLANSAENAAVPTPVTFTSNGVNVFIYKYLDQGAANVWDSIDDHNNAGALLTDHPWSSAAFICGGISMADDDEFVWQDASRSGCENDPDNCVMKDRITGKLWSNRSPTLVNWSEAIVYCENLEHDGFDDWYLPTQKELLLASAHGIRSAAHDDWISLADMAISVWSSTTRSTVHYEAYRLFLGNGASITDAKNLPRSVICTR